MEKIIIKNFLIFDDVEMEIKRLNILIGEQASGKSLLAKLVYFFTMCKNNLAECILFDDTEQMFAKLENDFLDIFPPKFWQKDFSIEYDFNIEFQLKVIGNYSDKKINISLINQNDDSFKNLVNKAKQEFSNTVESEFDDDLIALINKISEKSGQETVSKEDFLAILNDNMSKNRELFVKLILATQFIPANRSSLSFLNKNALALLTSNDLNIDPLLRKFGITLNKIKEDYFNNNSYPLIEYFEKIIKGKFDRINNEDWLVNDDKKIPVHFSSSGQQEAFPLMLFLFAVFFKQEKYQLQELFIEEPEAHLFPQAQNVMVSAFSYILHHAEIDNLFITTHSPYILSAVNNAILANDMVEKGKINVEDYVKMSDGAYPISLDDVSAYSMSGGKITNIKDEEYRMIGGEILDEVSNHFGEVMDKLLSLDD
ncbi:MAG: AAA family ATPase [Moraxellaceae bacterium]|nr:AAA family ATPase [Moraxellaceae bacterium]